MSGEIIFVTAFKDIFRKNWSSYNRSNAEYIGLFLNMARRIPYNLVVFCEETIRNELALYDLPNVEYCDWNEVDTFYKRYLDIEREIIESEAYKAKVAPHRFLNPEHLYAEYNLVNHSKINFVRHTKQLYPNYRFYAWLDFGFCRNVKDCPMNVDTTLLKEKITYLALREPNMRIEPEELLRSDEVYLTGSMFIAHSESVELFEEIFEKKIREYHTLGLSDDDQSLVSQIYWDNPDWFHLVIDREWFSLFRKHYNRN